MSAEDPEIPSAHILEETTMVLRADENEIANTPAQTTSSEDNNDRDNNISLSLTLSRQSVQSVIGFCTELITIIYKNRYYRNIMKSLIIFAIALEMSQECKMLVIPLKAYKPFHRKW